jgi:hypothetical protein
MDSRFKEAVDELMTVVLPAFRQVVEDHRRDERGSWIPDDVYRIGRVENALDRIEYAIHAYQLTDQDPPVGMFPDDEPRPDLRLVPGPA